MSAEAISTRLRQFLLMLAVILCLGTLGELLLLDHMEEPLQFVPFVLCGLASIMLIAVYVKPQRSTIWTLRGLMGIMALGGLLGIVVHFTGNQAFAQEINQQATGSDLLWATLTGGSPIFAPGVLTITAIVAYAGTYFHPALRNSNTA